MPARDEATAAESGAEPVPDAPSVSIYQDPTFVTAILQQMVERGLLTVEEQEWRRDTAEAKSRGVSARTDADGKASVPALGRLSLAFSVEGQRSRTEDSATAGVFKQRVEYSQAYYLHLVRRLLRENGRVVRLDSRSDALDLPVGAFVEFKASFNADEAGALLDVLTPDFVAAITRFIEHQKTMQGFDDVGGFDKLQEYIAKRKVAEDAAADFARAVAAAIRVDFRSEATRQYYGEVNAGSDTLHVITICEKQHFISADEDRLLDGTFTVLGKLVAAAHDDPAILAPNKLLSRINPAVLDLAFRELKKAGDSLADDQLIQRLGGDEVGTLLDTSFRARLQGTAIKVLPVAIYV